MSYVHSHFLAVPQYPEGGFEATQGTLEWLFLPVFPGGTTARVWASLHRQIESFRRWRGGQENAGY